MSSYQDLRAQADAIIKQAEKVRKKEIPSVIARIRAAMNAYGITLDDLKSPTRRGKKGRGKVGKRAPVQPKYRNPKTGETWSGRGRAPRWLAAEEAKGRKRDSFLIAAK
jgi:DNA-binding protein H-NS